MNYLKKATKTINNKVIKNLPKAPLPIPSAALSRVTAYFQKADNLSGNQKLFRALIKSQKEMLSSNKMSELAARSYNMQNFEEILGLILSIMEHFAYQLKKAYQTRNTMILIGYLLRHGASGFIDQFRSQKQSFQKCLQIQYSYCLAEDDDEHRKIKQLVEQIRSRSKYILDLLEDKSKMLKQKELSMLVKQKMKIQKEETPPSGNRTSAIYTKSNKHQLQSYSYTDPTTHKRKTKKQKVEDFLQNYLYKYISKIDQRLDSISDKIVMKIDEYLVGQIPEDFQIDQLEQQQPKLKTQTDLENKTANQEQNFKCQRLKQRPQQTDLI